MAGVSSTSQEILTKTVTLRERLKQEGYFSAETIDVVTEVAKRQWQSGTYQEYFASLAIPSPQLFVGKSGAGVIVVDVPAKRKEEGVLVMHLPMANPLDTNQLFQVATIVAANPGYRVIAFGNPSGGAYRYKAQALSSLKRRGIASDNHSEYLVETELAYLASQKLTRVSHIGYSFGALKALLESYHAGTIAVEHLITIEPPAHPRPLIQLASDFLRTDAHLNRYVDRADTPIFIQARKDAVNGRDYRRGLLRPINIAIARLLARADFIDILTKTMVLHPALRVTLSWAGKSELGNDAHFTVSAHHLSLAMPGRLNAMRFADAHHSVANDPYLHAAIITESLDGS